MKLIKISIILLIIAAGLSSCDGFLDVNDDVNNPTGDNVTPDLILPAAQNGTYNSLIQNQHRLGTIMMNQWAGDVTNFTGGNDAEYHYNISNTFYDQVWTKMYLVTDKFQAIINKNTPEYTNYTAIALILKSHNMQYMVDLYGNVPYSDAFQRGENYQPKYDDAKSIYMGLYDALDQAINMIDNAGSTAINPGAADVMLGGDMDMWKKLANTLKLKLLVRASSSTDSSIQAFVNAKYPQLAGVSFLGAGENVTINPGYAVDTGKQNPFWNQYGFQTNGDRTRNNQFYVGSEYFIDYLIASSDSRISKFFNFASGTSYQGIEQGADDPDVPSLGLSFIGDGLLRTGTQDGWFFTSSESLLLQAEAALNGKITGSAQQLFEDGITESFNLLDLSSDAAAYVTSIGAVDLEKIITQKWVGLHAVDGAEILIEHNRTGFPNPPLPLLTNDAHRPYRLMYPQSEFVGNSANVINIPRAQIFVPSLFWQL